MELNRRKIRVQVWQSGEAGPTISLDGELVFDSEPKVGDVIFLGNRGFEMTHKEFEKEAGKKFINFAVFRHEVGKLQNAIQMSESISNELGN